MNNLKNRINMLLKHHAANDGFTLLELMIVITIIAIIGGFAVSRFTSTIDKTKVTAVKTDFGTFETALDAYYLNHNTYPTTQEGLQKLLDDGLIKNKKDSLLDPWNNPYQYRYPGEFSQGPEIWCFGADGKEGGEGINEDLKSWE
jgi:general secretion pathway protein G